VAKPSVAHILVGGFVLCGDGDKMFWLLAFVAVLALASAFCTFTSAALMF
jgi:hypothetical protein